MTVVATAIGSKHIYPSTSILYPLGRPTLLPEQEKELRKEMAHAALKELTA